MEAELIYGLLAAGGTPSALIGITIYRFSALSTKIDNIEKAMESIVGVNRVTDEKIDKTVSEQHELCEKRLQLILALKQETKN